MDQYKEMFIEESRDHLQHLNDNLLELEKKPTDLELVNHIFRAAHTLKGMSATMGYSDLADLTHIMENILDDIRKSKLSVSSRLLDVIFIAVDELEAMVESIASGGDGKRDISQTVILLKNIDSNGLSIDLAAQQTGVTIETEQKINQYDQFEMTIIEQSKEQGFECFEITVTLREDCLLKAVRVFMVFEVLEKLGEVIKSTPKVDQLEEEHFDSSFTVAIISKENAFELKEKIMKVSEVEFVEITSVQFKQSQSLPDMNENEDLKQSIANKDMTESGVHKNQNRTIRVNIERLDRLMNLVEELVIDRGRLEQISHELKNPDLAETVERMSRVSSELQDIILNMRMVPVDTVFNRFPRMVRQVAKELHKEIELKVIGEDTELDRTVIDEIGDPIVHLLRNAMDHGIEHPNDRLKKGKQQFGTIELKAHHSGNSVFIEIEDDGAGIDRKKVVEKAIANGIITIDESESLTDEDAFGLIMEPGFSTADTITDISGRGVGLDVVKSTIQSLGGSISINSVQGKGSKFSIQLPLTLSIIAAMLVEVGNERYAIPITSILETAIIEKSDILLVHEQQVIDYRGKVVPLISLKKIFAVDSDDHDDQLLSIVIVRRGEKLAALIVDTFIGQQEIVLKSLGSYLSDVFAISGATILGDGQVALIIDCNSLI